jgi:hypothetical protein
MLTNNEILKKLRVALQLKDTDIIEILKLVDFEITKGALGDLFRTEDHPSYVEAGDQILRNFLNGLVIYKRGPMSDNKGLEIRNKSEKPQPNIIPKIEQKKEKSTYKPYMPKDKMNSFNSKDSKDKNRNKQDDKSRSNEKPRDRNFEERPKSKLATSFFEKNSFSKKK